MGQEISWEIRQQAEELYIFDGLTYQEIADNTGVSLTQLKRWGQSGEWGAAKKEQRDALSKIRRQKILLRQGLMERALNSLDPQDVYAVARMESIATRKPSTKDAPIENIKTDLSAKSPAEIINALEKLTVSKLNQMSIQPGLISLSGIKEMKNALDLIEKMKMKYVAETEEKQPANEENRKQLIDEVDQILGVR